jgi:hypothetical protein
LRQPLHYLNGRTSPYPSSLDEAGRTIGAVQRTASPALHRHPELALAGARRNPEAGLRERQFVEILYKNTPARFAVCIRSVSPLERANVVTPA